MAYIRLVQDDEATGKIKRHFDAAIGRAGRVFGIVRLMSPNEEVLGASMRFYMAIMKGESPLSRRRREMLATVVSRVNDCFYWTKAHGADFRTEALREGADPDTVERETAAFESDWTTTELDPVDRALCAFADKVTRAPATCGQADVDQLRGLGLDDRTIHDAAQVIGYFNYINRIADCLGVDLEPEMLQNK